MLNFLLDDCILSKSSGIKSLLSISQSSYFWSLIIFNLSYNCIKFSISLGIPFLDAQSYKFSLNSVLLLLSLIINLVLLVLDLKYGLLFKASIL
jgi:hypothetical protein